METENVFRCALDYALEIVLIFDGKGIITYANKNAGQALQYENLCGSSVMEVFPQEFRQENGKLVAECAFGENIQNMMAYRGNRTCFSVEVRMMKCPGDDSSYLCLAHDATKQDLLEKTVMKAGQEVEEAAKVKTQFVANVTHELRTPVNGILGNTRELITRETEAEKLRILRLVERGCDDMNSIINNILDFSKLEAGKFTLDPAKFNFRNMIDYVKSNHINKITEKGLELFVTVSPSVPEYIIGDELRIVQILNNLMSNACKFTSVGKIALEVVKTAEVNNRIELFFMVIDSGIGIDRSDQDKLFKSFSQVEASTSRKYGGTGLGLNICKQLVELMDGNIQVQSQIGKGTMFSFHIWVDIPEEEKGRSPIPSYVPEQAESSLTTEFEDDSTIWNYGHPNNIQEIEKKMSKLILSVEMENWEKAEMFMDTLRQLTAEGPQEVRSAMLRLKMAVQKADVEKTVAAYEKFEETIRVSVNGGEDE